MILVPCILTVLIEGIFFRLLGFRDREDLLIIALVNVVTNLSLNLFLLLTGLWNIPAIAFLEILVVLVEYAVYGIAFGGSRRLFFLTLAANVLSLSIGLVIL